MPCAAFGISAVWLNSADASSALTCVGSPCVYST